ERTMYYDRCLRLRDFRKPTIAAVQGKCVAAGLMLACMCDLIVAADDAVFQNPVLRMTGAGVELLVEPWELGIRKAKEFLWTGMELDAQEAWRLGLVNRVVARDELHDRTRELAAKVEQPDGGDFMRTIGPFVVPEGAPEGTAGYSLFWAVEGRGRKGVTLDLRKPEGQDLFKRLTSHAHVVCENFRPGTLERWNIGPADCDPNLVWVRISVFGQDGPYSQRPGLDRLGIGYGGLLHLTGYPDRPPVRPGVTTSDYLTGVFAAEAAVSLLYRRDRPGGTGGGGVGDAPLYGSVLRILEWTIAGYDKLGIVREREGNRLANSAPLDNYPTADGKYVCIVAG